MNYTSATPGRIFVARLNDGDILHTCIEELATREGVRSAVCWFLGGADDGSKLVVGPEDGTAAKIVPVTLLLSGAHEAAAVGTIFTNETGHPILHMHGAFGRGASVRAGCVRQGIKTWLVGEVVVVELLNCSAGRKRQPETGFELLEIPGDPAHA